MLRKIINNHRGIFHIINGLIHKEYKFERCPICGSITLGDCTQCDNCGWDYYLYPEISDMNEFQRCYDSGMTSEEIFNYMLEVGEK